MLGQLFNLVSVFGAGCAEKTFFGLLPWYHYLTKKVESADDPATPKVETVCTIVFNPLPTNGRSDILLVLLVIIDDLLRLAGLVAIGFIIWGGVLYLTSQGAPDQTQRAQQTIQNALLGLVICILSIALVSFIGARIG
jgi:hypothetical protein